ncbi:hypothetical protein BU26DRAFT_228679 [Trematosphaeria pertusa]|uniref:Uncharacterized protein n=1 Tax=Trematosphaeria pertusa TaxID=390896 RepID=A0A6A6IUY6_9PLEO|nr:uncharacterized protein BU26DRAFT_228679 [Trematosphaeria pertusa]KAF2253702.1 hypothetical protein BU26DRAFT_228679 [Trematosphaeria pertusa]
MRSALMRHDLSKNFSMGPWSSPFSGRAVLCHHLELLICGLSTMGVLRSDRRTARSEDPYPVIPLESNATEPSAPNRAECEVSGRGACVSLRRGVSPSPCLNAAGIPAQLQRALYISTLDTWIREERSTDCVYSSRMSVILSPGHCIGLRPDVE